MSFFLIRFRAVSEKFKDLKIIKKITIDDVFEIVKQKHERMYLLSFFQENSLSTIKLKLKIILEKR